MRYALRKIKKRWFVCGMACASACYAQSSSSINYRPNIAGIANGRTVEAKLAETLSVVDFGAKPDGTDAGPGILRALTAASARNACVFFPYGNFAITTTLSWTGALCIRADTGAAIVYSGSGTALALTNLSGSWNGLVVRSTTGTAAIGVDILGGTEFFADYMYIGGAPTSGFTVGLRLRASSGEFNHLTSSWNGTGVLLDTYASANSLISLFNGAYFQASKAGIEITDVGPLSIKGNAFEALQNAILLDNTSSAVVATGAVEIIGNTALFINENGITYTAPYFLYVFANNVSNAMNIKQFHVDQNNVGGSSLGLYCNKILRNLAVAGNTYNMFFSGNNWGDCTLAATYGETSAVNIIATDESPAGIPEFNGGMVGLDISMTDAPGMNVRQFNNGYAGLDYIAPSAGVVSGVTNYNVSTQSQSALCASTLSADVAMLLPSSPLGGQVVTIKKVDTGAHDCIIAPQGKNVDGSTSNFNLDRNYGTVTLWYDGTAWWTLSLTSSSSSTYTQGTGVTITGLVVSIGQAIGTGDSPTFLNGTITGVITVNGNINNPGIPTSCVGAPSGMFYKIGTVVNVCP